MNPAIIQTYIHKQVYSSYHTNTTRHDTCLTTSLLVCHSNTFEIIRVGSVQLWPEEAVSVHEWAVLRFIVLAYTAEYKYTQSRLRAATPNKTRISSYKGVYCLSMEVLLKVVMMVVLCTGRKPPHGRLAKVASHEVNISWDGMKGV